LQPQPSASTGDRETRSGSTRPSTCGSTRVIAVQGGTGAGACKSAGARCSLAGEPRSNAIPVPGRPVRDGRARIPARARPPGPNHGRHVHPHDAVAPHAGRNAVVAPRGGESVGRARTDRPCPAQACVRAVARHAGRPAIRLRVRSCVRPAVCARVQTRQTAAVGRTRRRGIAARGADQNPQDRDRFPHRELRKASGMLT
jgi:hypothetical protein